MIDTFERRRWRRRAHLSQFAAFLRDVTEICRSPELVDLFLFRRRPAATLAGTFDERGVGFAIRFVAPTCHIRGRKVLRLCVVRTVVLVQETLTASGRIAREEVAGVFNGYVQIRPVVTLARDAEQECEEVDNQHLEGRVVKREEIGAVFIEEEVWRTSIFSAPDFGVVHDRRKGAVEVDC